jgi:hypothetical protein
MESILKYAALGPVVTAFVALFAAVLAFKQVKLNRQNEAKRQFLNLLDECLKNPLLSVGEFEETPAGRVTYHWFLSKLLMSSESLLENFPNDVAWRTAIKQNLAAHARNLDVADIKNSYSVELNGLIQEIRADTLTVDLASSRYTMASPPK